MLDDPQEIEKTRRAFEREQEDLFKKAVALVAAGEWILSEHESALKQHGQKATEALRAIVADEKSKSEARAKAAETLISLKDETGLRFLLESLEAKSPELRVAVLRTIGRGDVPIDVVTPEHFRQLLSMLDDENEEVVQAAAGVCVDREIPGTESKLVALLEGGKLRDPESIVRVLSKVASTKQAVMAILPHIARDHGEEEYRHDYVYSFERILNNSDPEISEPLRKAIYKNCLRYAKPQYGPYDYNLLRDLAGTADRESIPLLEDIYRNNDNFACQVNTVEALARLQPEKAVNFLLDLLGKAEPYPDFIRLLKKYAAAADYDRVVPVALSAYTRTGRKLDGEFAKLLLQNFGERGRGFAQEHVAQFDDEARMWVEWKLQGFTLRSALADLHSAGEIRTAPDDLIEKMQKAHRNNKYSKPFDPTSSHELIGALGTEGILIAFDVETGSVCCDHHRLILSFAEATTGRFQPQYPVQFWHQQNKDDYDGPYTVQFVYGNRLYRVGAENYGDWYDVEAVVQLLNFALETAKQKERFIGLDVGGQIAFFVFADPNTFVPIAAKYFLPLSTDASKAMQQGLEFERRAIDKK